jgi:predicted esterase
VPLRLCVKIPVRFFGAVLLALLFVGALVWAAGRDPFERRWFNVHPAGAAKAECIAILPKMAVRPLPVVVYLHGSGGELLGDGNELRQMAEMGIAAVGMEYEQKTEDRGQRAEDRGRRTEGRRQGAEGGDAFEGQFTSLLEYLQRQRWVDTNRIAWVGYSLGAQRLLSFAVRHPDLQPSLLVRLAGGWIPELEQFEVQSSRFKVQGSLSRPSTLNSQPSTSVLLVHAEHDEVFPLADAQRVAACLRTNGVPVELRVLPGESHGLGGNRLLVFRVIGEQCLTRLKGADALGIYRSILSWQAQAKPLWLFWMPALLWAAFWPWLRRKLVVGQASRLPPGRASVPASPILLSPQPVSAFDSPGPESGMAHPGAGGTAAPLFWWEIGLRWLAPILAAAALAQTALHLVPPRLPISERTLGIARGHLVQNKELGDFEFLTANPVWRGKPLKTLLEHVELANYNRELINWKLDEPIYQQFVLSPEIDPVADGDLSWRRPLWENFYPRIRKEQGPEAAAEIVARFLRERVTIAQGSGLASTVAEIWRRQIANERGFEAVYVAALRSVGVASRLGPQSQAEFWTGAAWQAAPRPLIGR